ncbi:MFS transporter [Yersinia bercovieri]|uniref:MFS transporter n=2 Tax=Yersinia bercovieri TaxID=634 RepID=A0A2G4U0L7_YERBE|nr:MFS transporter [Yersinia bercovieri]EEQ08548.1 Permease of the major facilitator superfamily [Yersinia bercovieri ATCC 43970]MCB5300921.1 MFS transporter [Yersinia bercovieri]PHZ26802.1 MFS transporter [Yersinia bercovieri]QKJ08288.1 MFS transporter [Yersinia bercovieri ATCC 43970]CNE36788.1 proline/glycine betaine transporter [Yersinia bercovieri]
MKWKFRLGAVAGNALEYYDIAVFAAISVYLTAELERQGYSQATQMVWGIFALRFIIRPVGGYIIGRYADRAGRKSALILTSFISGSATLCMALLPIGLLGPYTPLAILVLQMALSFSYAGEWPTLTTYLFNDAANNERARISVLITSSAVMGVIASLLLVFVLERSLDPVTMQTVGWRIPLLLGVVNIAVSFWFRARLPIQPLASGRYRRVNWRKSLQILLINVPGSVVFYAQNMSSSLIRDNLQLGDFKSLYAILSSTLILFFMLICGWLTDKYSSSARVLNAGVIGLILLSVPLYYVICSNVIELILFAQLIIIINTAMISSTMPSVLAEVAEGQTTTLSMGYNISSTLAGGLTPLIISYLVSYDLVYAGGYIALSGFSLLLSYWLFKPDRYQRKTEHAD